MTPIARLGWFAVLGALSAACSGSVSNSDAAGAAGGGAVADSAASCESGAAQVASEVGTMSSCTVLVRLDYTTLSVLGHAVYCGAVAPMSEADASAIAMQTAQGSYPTSLISGRLSVDEWVFSNAIGDFGEVTAVSARNGQTVFKASLAWNGVLDPPNLEGARGGPLAAVPSESTSDWGSGCAVTVAPTLRSFDLRSGAGGAEAQPAAALSQVLRTALPAGLQRAGGQVLDAVVLVYGGRMPDGTANAEYVVLLNAEAN